MIILKTHIIILNSKSIGNFYCSGYLNLKDLAIVFIEIITGTEIKTSK